MEVSVDVLKIDKFNVYSTVFLTSGGGVDHLLVRLSLIEQIVKDVSLICISFKFKHPQTFWESWMSLSNMSRTICNMCKYPFNPQLVKKHKLKIMIRIQKIKWTFIFGPLFFKRMGVFHSWVDYFSVGVWAFLQNINFFIFNSLCMLVSICYSF